MEVQDQQALWRRICSGDREAFASFYRVHAGRIQQFLRRATGDRDAAQDVTQEVFLQLWQRPNGFDPERGHLVNYVFGMARKRAADWWRHRRPAESQDANPPERSVPDSGRRQVIEDLLTRLEPDLAGLLWLREVEGRSYAELASIFEIPEGTVKSRLFAAREELRRLWNSRRMEGERQ